MSETAVETLISPADPSPVEVVHPDSDAGVVLLCEHAGRAIPASLGTLGIGKDVLNSHRGWDIGAEDLARALADALRAPLVIQRYSRLVIDCNRPPGTAPSIPVISDQCEVPANKHAGQAEKDARVREIFDPLNRQLTDLFDRHRRRAAFSIHSFTPTMDGQDRPWHAGFLARAETGTAEALLRHIADARPDLTLALNQPYQIDDETDWFIPRHAEPRGLPHCLIEVRNDQIDRPRGAARWAELLAPAIGAVMERLP